LRSDSFGEPAGLVLEEVTELGVLADRCLERRRLSATDSRMSRTFFAGTPVR